MQITQEQLDEALKRVGQSRHPDDTGLTSWFYFKLKQLFVQLGIEVVPK